MEAGSGEGEGGGGGRGSICPNNRKSGVKSVHVYTIVCILVPYRIKFIQKRRQRSSLLFGGHSFGRISIWEGGGLVWCELDDGRSSIFPKL